MKKWLYTCYGNYASKSFKRIKDCISLDLIKSETNRKIIEKIYDKLQEKLDNNDVVSFFEEDEIVNKVTEILAKDFEMTDEDQVDKAIEDIENFYKREKQVKRRDEILKLLSNNEQNENSEKLMEELNGIISELTNKKN